jgi:hypothetical protein
MRSTLIRNRSRAGQLLAFDGMQYGKCRPTDIDLAIDWQGRTFAFVEMKGRGMKLELGQKIHLQHLVNGLRAADKLAFAIHAHHDTPNTDDDVHVAEALVWSVYTGSKWERELAEVTVDEKLAEIYDMHLNWS